MEAFATQFTTSLNGPSVELRGKVGKSEFGFDFAISGGQANLTALFAGNRIPVGDFLKVIHVSLRPDQNAFSLLLFYDVPKQRTLVAFYLSRVNATKPQVEFTHEPYNYLFGRGTKLGWSKDGPLKISACGTAPSELEDMIGKAAKQWQSVLESRLTLQTVPTVDCPPFSDLNTRGVYYVASWIEAAGPDVSVTGQTAPVPDFEHGILMDGDIFILTGEFQEMLNRYLPGQNMNSPDTLDFLVKAEIASTMLHEMGHLLGLHHQFDPKISSIMSYVDNPNALTDYDAKAVQTLYSK